LLMLILVVETINSAIETVVDRISLERHVQSRIAKDMGSAAVGLVILMNVVTWIYVLFLMNT
jgi:diacylglycerol kinase (ATP)